MSYKANQEKMTVSSTGKVGSATTADSATTAGSASSVADASITTAKLADGAVTGIKRTSTILNSVVIPNASYEDIDGYISSVSVTCSGQKVRLSFVGENIGLYKGIGRDSIYVAFAVFRNGVFLSGSNRGSGYWIPVGTAAYNNSANGYQWVMPEAVFTFIDEAPPVGVNTYAISLNTSEDGGVNRIITGGVSLVAREV